MASSAGRIRAFHSYREDLAQGLQRSVALPGEHRNQPGGEEDPDGGGGRRRAASRPGCEQKSRDQRQVLFKGPAQLRASLSLRSLASVFHNVLLLIHYCYYIAYLVYNSSHVLDRC